MDDQREGEFLDPRSYPTDLCSRSHTTATLFIPVACFEIIKCEPSNHIFLWNSFAPDSLGPLHLHIKFRILILSISIKKSGGSFDRSYVESVDQFGDCHHLTNIKSLDLWTWNIFLFILIVFSFFQQHSFQRVDPTLLLLNLYVSILFFMPLSKELLIMFLDFLFLLVCRYTTDFCVINLIFWKLAKLVY